MSAALTRYHQLEDELKRIRALNKGFESAEEDYILEEMDLLWYQLDEDEQERINTDPQIS